MNLVYCVFMIIFTLVSLFPIKFTCTILLAEFYGVSIVRLLTDFVCAVFHGKRKCLAFDGCPYTFLCVRLCAISYYFSCFLGD